MKKFINNKIYNNITLFKLKKITSGPLRRMIFKLEYFGEFETAFTVLMNQDTIVHTVGRSIHGGKKTQVENLMRLSL